MSGHLTREEKNIDQAIFDKVHFEKFNDLKIWLKETEIPYQEKVDGIRLKGIFISKLLKVYFDGSRKGYQYYLEGIKERLIKEFDLTN